MKRLPFVISLLSLLSCSLAWANAPVAIPTFHSMGLYWTPDTPGARDKDVTVRYREQGTTTWHQGLAMRHNPISGTDAELASYRGSVVMLQPGTSYEFELALEGSSEKARLVKTTWQPQAPEGKTKEFTKTTGTHVIKESGKPGAYVVYDGKGATFDAQGGDFNFDVQASYIILRNFKLQGATRNAIMLRDVHDVIIEDNDISKWGRPNPVTPQFGENQNAAVWGGPEVERIVVQRNRIHHPNQDTNSWKEETCNSSKCTFHPSGPQAVVFVESKGNHVIRYNEIFSDDEHRFNDIIGAGRNASFKGFPGQDSDIYQNYLSHCWDDGLEIEGGGRNVRIWGNYIERCFIAIGNAPTRIGPLYIFRNIGGESSAGPRTSSGAFLKMGFAFPNPDNKPPATLSLIAQTGHAYIFHNTLDPRSGKGFLGFGPNRFIHHTITRNNIIALPNTEHDAISQNKENMDNDFDFDLYNSDVPQGHEARGIRGNPTFASNRGLDRANLQAHYHLSPKSPGFNQGEVIPNFSDAYQGKAPDIGAHEHGTAPLEYGPKATTSAQAPSPCQTTSATEVCGNDLDDNCNGEIDEGCKKDPPVEPNEKLATARQSDRSITIDGDLTDLLQASGDTPALSLTAPSGKADFFFTWNKRHLYVGAVVKDDTLVALVDPPQEGRVWQDDALEIFLDPSLAKTTAFTKEQVQVVINLKEATFLEGLDAIDFATSLEGELDTPQAAKGWRLEMAIPWQDLNLQPAADTTFGANFALNDRDSSAPSAMVDAVDWSQADSFREPSTWGEILLVANTTQGDMDNRGPADMSTPSPNPNADMAQPTEQDMGGVSLGPDLGSSPTTTSPPTVTEDTGCSNTPHSPPTSWLLLLGLLGLLVPKRSRHL